MESENYDCVNSSSDDNIKEKITKKEEINKFTAYNKNDKYIDKYKINIPIDLKIDKYYFTIYHKKINEEFVYRCKYANACKVK